MRRVTVALLCDAHAEEAEEIEATRESLTYTVEGTTYELDLCEKHETEFALVMQPWMDLSRVAGKPEAPKRSHTKKKADTPAAVKAAEAPDPSDPVKVRNWATANGVPVSARGRIAEATRKQYAAAH